jgi:8-oxo-dGTP pyrophosphatase MutT (NUDIX family)
MSGVRADAKPSAPRKVLRPRDAATLIVVDSSSGEPRVLLGRRRPDLVFMPGRYVFPGGRVDPADRQIAVEHDLAPGTTEKLLVAMKGNPSPARARALALAAVRETFEEAGLLIGTPAGDAPPVASAWQKFFTHGCRPSLARIDVLCARHHAARARAASTRVFLGARRGDRSQNRDCRRRTVRPRMAFDRAGAHARAAEHHSGCVGRSGRGHRGARCTTAMCLSRSPSTATAISTGTLLAPMMPLTRFDERILCARITVAEAS